jgi:hypothetical protein
MKIKIVLFSCICLNFFSCTTLKPYDRIYVDDPTMQLGATSGEAFENYVESIREGGASAGSGKSGGGCGCN